MIEHLSELHEQIDIGALLGKPFQNLSDIDIALEQRDSDSFEREFLRLHNQLQATKEFPNTERVVVDGIREKAFKAVYNWSQSPELAGYVSDDFELIARGIASNTAEPWLAVLLASYQAGRFFISWNFAKWQNSLAEKMETALRRTTWDERYFERHGCAGCQ